MAHSEVFCEVADVRIVAGWWDHAVIWIDGEQLANFEYRNASPVSSGGVRRAGAREDGDAIAENADQVTIGGDLTLQKFEFK